jgi:hypothetical protein
MVSEQRTGKRVEGSGCCLISSAILEFAWRDCGKARKVLRSSDISAEF